MAKKQPQHGGKREGAGRKPMDPDGAVKLVVAVPNAVVERLDAIAAQRGQNRSDVVREAITTLLKRA